MGQIQQLYETGTPTVYLYVENTTVVWDQYQVQNICIGRIHQMYWTSTKYNISCYWEKTTVVWGNATDCCIKGVNKREHHNLIWVWGSND